MNKAEIEALAETFCRLEGWADVSPLPDFAALCREAYRAISWEAEWKRDTAVITTVINQWEYILDFTSDPTTRDEAAPEWKILFDPAVYDVDTDLAVTNEIEVERHDPHWFMRVAGTPRFVWLVAPNILRVYPKPDTAGKTITVRGIRTADDLVNQTDVPTCPSKYHRGIAQMAASLHGEIYAQGDAAARVAYYRAAAEAAIAGIKDYLGAQDAPSTQRRCERRSREILLLQ